MKKQILKLAGLIVLFVLPVTLMSQDRGQGRGNMEERMKQQQEELKKTLDLKKDQAEKFDKIYVDFNKKRQALFTSVEPGGDRSAMRDKMTKMNEERDAAVKKLLDKDQLKKFEAYQKKLAEERANRGDGGGRGGR